MKIKLLVTIIVCGLALSVVFPGPHVPTVAAAAASPFGLMITAPGMTPLGMVSLASSLGVTQYRPSTAIFVTTWTGVCAQCQAAHLAGLDLILTVRASGGPGVPSSPPANLADYRVSLGAILDATQPAILVVENEENSGLFYTGTPQQYGVQLQAACEVAHSRGIQCTNGGLVSTLVALLTWEDIRVHDNPGRACDFAKRAFVGTSEPVSSQDLCKAKSTADLPLAVQQIMAKGHALLAAYRTAGMDTLNFHWYVAEPEAMGQAVEFLRATSGLAVLTNEIGQEDENPSTPPALLAKALDLGLPVVVWFSIDMAKARSLINPDTSLRPNGEAYRDFVGSH